MSIKTKISLNIDDFKKKLAEMSAKVKTTFQNIRDEINKDLKDQFGGKKLWSAVKANLLGGGVIGLIKQAFQGICDVK